MGDAVCHLVTICAQNGAVATYVAFGFVFRRLSVGSRLRLHDGAAARLVPRTDEDRPRKRPSRVAGCVSFRKDRSQTGLSSHVSGDAIDRVQSASHTPALVDGHSGVDRQINRAYSVDMAKVVLTPEAADELDAVNEPLHARILRLLDRLEAWPNVSGAKRLTGNLAGYLRLRTGDYRVLFRTDGDRVIVEKIGHRDRFYGG